MDRVSKDVRSRMMASVRGKGTTPEIVLGRRLHALGFRYRKNVRSLPGTPDLVFPKFGAVVFVNGCFWHRHGCRRTTTPKTNEDFWEKKFVRNVERDVRKTNELLSLGWRVLVVWECELVPSEAERTCERVASWLRVQHPEGGAVPVPD